VRIHAIKRLRKILFSAQLI